MPNPRGAKLAALKPSPSILTAATETISRYQLAARLGISLDTLDRLHAKGAGPPRFKLRSSWYYRIIDVETWLAQRVAAEARCERLASKHRKRATEQQSEINPNEAA